MTIPRIALLIESSNAYARGLLAGIAEYVQERGPWSVYLPETGRSEIAPGKLRGWKGDGVIVRAEDDRTAEALQGCGCPVVDLSVAGLLPNAPSVHSNVREEARLAFEHLWERGYRNLGFCGVKGYRWVQWQFEQFKTLAEERGCTVASSIEPLRLKKPQDWAADRLALAQWLTSLTPPVGIFACFDVRGQQVLDACRSVGLRVPDDAAVVGVDNDSVRCGLADPPLSSVAPDTRSVGYLAAELLGKMLTGQHIAPGLRLLPPLGVIARRSSDALAVEDPELSHALKYIREHACESIGVKQVLAEGHLSRRALEGRFVKVLGRTAHEEIIRCRIDRAKQLLCDTSLPIKTIAMRVGVGSPEYLSVLFKRVLNISPTDYRASHKRVRIESARE
jgi:LacI family transcriptional regulator